MSFSFIAVSNEPWVVPTFNRLRILGLNNAASHHLMLIKLGSWPDKESFNGFFFKYYRLLFFLFGVLISMVLILFFLDFWRLLLSKPSPTPRDLLAIHIVSHILLFPLPFGWSTSRLQRFCFYFFIFFNWYINEK